MNKKVLYYIPSVIVPILVNLYIVIVCGRYLIPAEYGMMSIYLTTIALLYSFGLSFIQSEALILFPDERSADTSVYFTTYTLSNLLMCVVVLAICLAIKIFIPTFNPILVVASVLCYGIYLFNINIDRMNERHVLYTVERCSAAILNLIIFSLLMFGFRMCSYLTPVVSMYGSYMLVGLVKCIEHRKEFNPSKFSYSLFRDSFKYGIPLVGVAVIGSIVANSDQYMLLSLLDKTSLGLYSLGYKISDYSLSRFSQLLIIVVGPVAIKSYAAHDISRARRSLNTAVDAISWFWMALLSFSLMYSSELIQIVFPNYIGAETVIKIIIIAALFHSVSDLYVKPFEITNHTKQILLFTFIAGLINVVYNFVFIPIHGVIAAAVSSVIAYFILVILMLVNGKKYIDLTPHYSFLVRLLFIGFCTCIVAFCVKKMWPCTSFFAMFAHVLICGIVYMVLSYFFGLFKYILEIERSY